MLCCSVGKCPLHNRPAAAGCPSTLVLPYPAAAQVPCWQTRNSLHSLLPSYQLPLCCPSPLLQFHKKHKKKR